MNTSLIPYFPAISTQEFIKLEFEKFQSKQLVDFIQTPTCHIGSLSNGKIVYLPKKDCLTTVKIRNCTHLRLYQAKLNAIPVEVKQLSNLLEIDLAGNFLTSLPHWINRFSCLTHLNLGRNKIETLPDEIVELTDLKEVNLYSNNLKAIPVQIFRIKNLQKLHLDDNKISIIPPDIKHLKSLEFLSIVQNNLKTISQEIKELKSLTTLCCLYDNNLDQSSEQLTNELGSIVQG
jgi:internalin A